MYQFITDLVPSVLLIVTLIGVAAGLLSLAARRFHSNDSELVTAINRLLPQTQCAQCGYPGCRPYAVAIAEGEAIDLCPPGGKEGVQALAKLLGREASLEDNNLPDTPLPRVAQIREEACIGCTLCIAACPVDAIIGAPQMMHTVLEDICTGCDLCRSPCPVDCIDLLPAAPTFEAQTQTHPPGSNRECINCGFCIEVCPRQLNPQRLYWYRQDMDKLLGNRLNDCIECGVCDRVCPSELPLCDTFTASKAQHRRQEATQKLAQETEARYRRHQQRLSRVKAMLRSRPSPQDRATLLAAVQAGLGQEGFGQEEIGQEEIGQEEIGQEGLGQEALGQEALSQEEIGSAVRYPP